jgi:hypothetical protein
MITRNSRALKHISKCNPAEVEAKTKAKKLKNRKTRLVQLYYCDGHVSLSLLGWSTARFRSILPVNHPLTSMHLPNNGHCPLCQPSVFAPTSEADVQKHLSEFHDACSFSVGCMLN